MQRIMLIDDDKAEAALWNLVIDINFSDAVSLVAFDDVDMAIKALKHFHPDIILVDNIVPPYRSAHVALKRLSEMAFPGQVYVWSGLEERVTRSVLPEWPLVPVLCKAEYRREGLKRLIGEEFIGRAAA